MKIITPFLGPIAALGLAVAVAGCGEMSIKVDGDGVPLSELDTSGAAPTGIALAGPDTVIVTTGSQFTITVEGDAAVTDLLRFELDGDDLTIYREGDNWSDTQRATVRVTMPSVNELVILGSGTIESDNLTGQAEVKIAGSGTARAAKVDAETLAIDFGGSGRFEGTGKAESLDFSVAGSGTADMTELAVGDAEVNIAGSGNAAFASDGKVAANIVGSGTVRVSGGATCTVTSVGSGELICDGGVTESAE